MLHKVKNARVMGYDVAYLEGFVRSQITLEAVAFVELVNDTQQGCDLAR
tara:strand:- start:577 stop:723 length:147 start_codon:yes stop_codon:yes gene_type:complete